VTVVDMVVYRVTFGTFCGTRTNEINS